MSILRKYKKNIERDRASKLLFIPECYNTLPGSLAVCNYAFLDEKPNPNEINKKMKILMTDISALPSFDSADYIDKTLEYFGMKRAGDLSIALVVGRYNTLFTFWDGTDILPLREDGVFTNTLRDKHSKIIPVDFSNIEKDII